MQAENENIKYKDKSTDALEKKAANGLLASINNQYQTEFKEKTIDNR